MSGPIPLTGSDIHAAGAPATQDGFTSDEISALVGEALSDEIEEGVGTPKAAQETPQTPAPSTPEDPVVEVPGLGQVKVSQIRGLMAQRAAFESLRRDKEALEQKSAEFEQLRSEAEETRQLRGLLNHKPFRDKMQQALAEFVASPDLQASGPDGKGPEFFQALRNPEMEELKQKYGQIAEYVSKVQEKEAALDIQNVLNEYATRYPELVTKEMQQTLVDAAVERFADQADTFQPAHFRAFVNESLSDQILELERQKARNEVLEQLKTQPSARVVTGTGTRAAAKPPEVNWVKKDWREIAASMANDLTATE